MHPENQTNLAASTEATALESAIAQAVLQHQQEQAAQTAAAQAARQAAEQKAIARFQLPFDDTTLNILPTINFRFEGETSALKTIGWFAYQDLTIEVSETARSDAHQSWELIATRNNAVVLTKSMHVYPRNWGGYQTSEQLGRSFLIFLHEAVDTPTPTPATKGSGHFGDYTNQRVREKFIEAAMQGTLIGLTNTGMDTNAVRETALFAIDTAEQVLSLMHATPLQRQVLSVLTLEWFTAWVRNHPDKRVVGSLTFDEHPICCYLAQKHGIMLNVDFSSTALYDDNATCVFSAEANDTQPQALPLSLVGDWLPTFLEWRGFDPDEGETESELNARDVLHYLETWQD